MTDAGTIRMIDRAIEKTRTPTFGGPAAKAWRCPKFNTRTGIPRSNGGEGTPSGTSLARRDVPYPRAREDIIPVGSPGLTSEVLSETTAAVSPVRLQNSTS